MKFKIGDWVLLEEEKLLRKVIGFDECDRIVANFYGTIGNRSEFLVSTLSRLHKYVKISKERAEKMLEDFILRTI